MPDRNRQGLNTDLREIGGFLLDITSCSKVVTQNPHTREFFVGSVVGPYEYWPDTVLKMSCEPYKHIRNVNWEVVTSRDDVKETTKGQFPPYQTAFWIDEDALEDIESNGKPIPPQSYWWVNQGKTYQKVRSGGFLWAPEKDKQGQTPSHWSDLRKAKPGDLVLNYSKKNLLAISRVISPAVAAPRSDGLQTNDWENNGYQVKIEYLDLDRPLSLDEIPIEYRTGGPGPFTVDGEVKQGYFYQLDDAVAREIVKLANGNGRNMTVVEPGNDSVDCQAIYDRLCAVDAEIRFPEWIVTDYLLSLATKPFVLLTGISGTGKTQIAQIVAEFLAGDEPVFEAEPIKRDDPNSAYHTVGKSTLRYGLLIPRNTEHLFPDAEAGKRRTVTIRANGENYPAVVEQVIFTDARRAPIMRLMWLKPSRQWIRDAAELDYVLQITPDPTNDEIIHIAVIKPPRKLVRTDARRVSFVPVRADWTDNRDLLGFYNILTEGYEATDLLRVMLRAIDEPEKLHFVILDEMNLAKVEYYFADFLSAMETAESGQGIPLHDQEDDVYIELDGLEHLVPSKLVIPPNVFFTGTVNIDETTHMFSPKVLDRANVIEFHDVDVRRHLDLGTTGGSTWDFKLTAETDISAMMVLPRNRELERGVLKSELGESLIRIHGILERYNRHFGYRVIDECARFLWLVKNHVGEASLGAAFDLQVFQKVLPKMTGNRSELQDTLERLMSYFNAGEDKTIGLDDLKAVREYDISGAHMPLSAAKVRRMLERLLAVGFTSFVE